MSRPNKTARAQDGPSKRPTGPHVDAGITYLENLERLLTSDEAKKAARTALEQRRAAKS